MKNSYIFNIILFLGILLLLNFFFHLHISIIGSLLLTVVINLVMLGLRRAF